MLVILSPSKTQALEEQPELDYTLPAHLDKTRILIEQLQQMSEEALSEVMGISAKLARLTHRRFADFSFPLQRRQCCQALLLFQGDVFTEIDAKNYTAADFHFAQGHLRILSGLYGTLRPLDLIQPYRLEIGGRFKPAQTSSLYDFWQEAVTGSINTAVASMKNPYCVNLASKEYFRVIKEQKLDAPVINISFKKRKGDTLQTIAIHAKKARGAMADFIIRNRIQSPDKLITFSIGDYRYSAEHSHEKDLLFVAPE